MRDRFQAELGATPAAGILAALAVGDQRAISAEEWRLFNRTGVTHLMSISGLHVTLVSGLAAWLVAFGWRRVPAAALRLPARKAAAAAAIVAALGYTLLAGFAVPAQRTFYMVTVVAAALWCGRIASPSRTLALALAVIVAADPWAPLAPGLWLSFGAVALIFYVGAGGTARHAVGPHAMGDHRRPRARRAAALRAGLGRRAARQCAWPFRWCRWSSRRWRSWPRFFRSADSGNRGRGWSNGCSLFSNGARRCPGALWQQHVPPLWAAAAAIAGAVWLLAPRGVPSRAAGLALMAPAFSLAPPAPAAGEAWITALDVGQGLAVVVRTASRTLLYDAGPAYGPEADSGGRIVVPMLRGAGIERLDMMVVSHEDVDHLGGALTRARDARGARARLVAAAGSCRSIRWCRERDSLRGRAALGMGRRALRVPAPAAGLGSRAAQQPELRAARRRPAAARCCSPGISSARRKIFWPEMLH